MSARLARHFLQRLSLAAALVLALCPGMRAQELDPLGPIPSDADVGNIAIAETGAQGYAPLSPQQLDELLGPVALYPDPLLAQVLAAATYPMDVVQAARFLNSSSDLSQLEQMGLDPSVQALARFPDVLRMMDEQLEWTNALGAAFLNQQLDVMDAVQRLRAQATASGALQDSPEQEIYVEDEFVGIVPADPEIIYVPQYVPEVVYGWSDPPIGGYYNSISFGYGCHTGSWLHLGFNWGSRCVAYRPWNFGHRHGFHRGGYARSYYSRAGWGRAWHRRSGPALPRFHGGGHRGGRDFSGLRRGFGRGSGRGPRDGFATGGSRGGFGNDPRSGPGEGFGNGTRRGQGRRDGSGSGFGNGPRGGQRQGPRDGFSNGPRRGPFGGFSDGTRSSERNGGMTSPGGSSNGFTRDDSRTGQTRGDFSGLGRGPRERFSESSVGGRPYSGNRAGLPGGSRSYLGSGSGGVKSGLLDGIRPDRSGQGSPRRLNSSSTSGMTRGSGGSTGGSAGRGWTGPQGSQRRGFGGGGIAPRSSGGSGFSRPGGSSTGGSGMRGFPGGGQSRGGSVFRGGGSSSSGPRIHSRSGGSSMRSPGGSSSGGVRSSGMRSGGSQGGGGNGMRGGGSRGGGGGRRGR